VEADDRVIGVEDPAVAGPRTPKRDALDVAHGRDTIASRGHVKPSTQTSVTDSRRRVNQRHEHAH
jgi:hypothetical protein